MGKFVKKGKITGDVAVMEVPQAALGVRTRAKTLALQQNPELCYLQLRSRRLEKPQFSPASPKKPEKLSNRNAPAGGNIDGHGPRLVQSQSQLVGSRFCVGPVNSGPAQSGSRSRPKKGKSEQEEEEGGRRFGTEVDDFGVEASFGENNFEFDHTGRSTRESTPCSFKRDFNSNGTPGSAVRSTCSGAACRRQSRNSVQIANSFTHEMEKFFASAEMQQQKHFMDKYNFDIVNDLPFSGRYEWVRIDR